MFIEAGLFYKALLSKHLRILEVGFGTGLNALVTLKEAKRLGLTIEYVGIEAYPISYEFVAELNYTEMHELAGLELEFDDMHLLEWNKRVEISDGFTLTKLMTGVEEANLSADFDLIYYDAFAPAAQPELWEADIMKKMYGALKPGGVLVTYCAKGEFKRTLKAVGFEVEALPGPPGKREMTKATRPM